MAATPTPNDSQEVLLRKILRNQIGSLPPAGTTAEQLRRILGAQGGPETYQGGDSEILLLRKILANQAWAIEQGAGSGGGTPATPTYRYFRFTIDGVGPGNYCEIQRILYLDESGTIWPTSAMTSDTTPAPFVVSGTPAQYGTNRWNAFDRSTATRWHSGLGPVGNQLTIDLGSPQAIVAVAVSFNNATTRYTSAFSVRGSNSGAFAGEEDLLFSASGFNGSSWAANGQLRVFYFGFSYANVKS